MKPPVQPSWPTPWRHAGLAFVHAEPLFWNTDQGNQSVAEWRGALYRGYPNPPPNQNDDAAVTAISDAYTSSLENLKTLVEGS